MKCDLISLVDNNTTDKNTQHSYLETYEYLLSSKKDTAKHVLEVGIHQGGSIKLWCDYFINAEIHAIDIESIDGLRSIPYPHNSIDEILEVPRIFLYPSSNAYDYDFFKRVFLDSDKKFDFILDDGSHAIDDIKKFIEFYSQILTDDGILVVEDILEYEYIDMMKESVPENLKEYIEVYDLRHIKSRFDDILFVINKNKFLGDVK